MTAYNEFSFCREMGWTPEMLAEQPADLVLRWMGFLAAEGEARKELADRAKGGRGRG